MLESDHKPAGCAIFAPSQKHVILIGSWIV